MSQELKFHVHKKSTQHHGGGLWASLPTELLQASRLVCKGWRVVHPRLQPSVPVHLFDTHTPARPSPGPPLTSSTAFRPAGRPTPATTPTLETPDGTHPSCVVTTQPAKDLLAWISRSFPAGELHHDGRVVLTLVPGNSCDDAGSAESPTHEHSSAGHDYHLHRGAPRSPAGPPGPGFRRMRALRRLADGVVASGDAAAALPSQTNPGARSSTARPLRDLLHHLGRVGQQHLRIQHAAAGPTCGLPAACWPCSCGSAVGVALHDRSGPAAAFHLASAAVAGPHSPIAVLPPAAPSCCGAASADCCHCCCGPAAPPTAQRRVPAPGLGAVASLRQLRSLELCGVRAGTRLLGQLAELLQLTRLCFDTPLPANRVTVLASLTALECLHFTITWPHAAPKVDEHAAGTGASSGAAVGSVAAEPTASPARGPAPDRSPASQIAETQDERGEASSSTTTTATTSSSSGGGSGISKRVIIGNGISSSDDSSGDEGLVLVPERARQRRTSGPLAMDSVAAALAALAPLTRLTHLRVRVSRRSMDRSFLSPPALLRAARAGLPRLRRFALQVLSHWQPTPETLYNWVALDPDDPAALRCFRDSPGAGDQGVFIWQDLDWALQGEGRRQEAQPPATPRTPGPVGQAGGARSAGFGAGGGGSNRAEGAAGGGGAAPAPTPAPAPPAAGGGGGPAQGPVSESADVAVGIRTSSTSWLGTCVDAAAALNAAVGSLPGCGLASLLLLDAQSVTMSAGAGAGEGSELLPHTLTALSGLSSLTLQEIQRPPRAAAGGPLQSDCLAQLMRLTSLRVLSLQTRHPEWLDVLLPLPPPPPPPPPPPQPQERSSGAGHGAGAADSSNPADPLRRQLGRVNYGGQKQQQHEEQQQQQRQSHQERQQWMRLEGPLLGGAGPGQKLEHLSLHLQCKAWAAPVDDETDGDVDDEEDEEDEDEEEDYRTAAIGAVQVVRIRDNGSRRAPGGAGGGRSERALVQSALRRLGLLQSLQSLHLHAATTLQVSWLPTGLQHLSLAGATLSLPPPPPPSPPPSPSPSPAAAPASAAIAAAAAPPPGGPFLPHLVSLSAFLSILPPLALLLPAAGCSQLTRLALSGCRTAGHDWPLPCHPYFTYPTPPNPPTNADLIRRDQLLLEAELDALGAQCGGSLRSIRVVQPGPAMAVGASAGSMRLLVEGLGRLPRLQALCWEVEAEQQERLLARLTGLRELRELVVCHHVGQEGRESLRQLTGLRSLVQLCPSRQGRRAEVWMRELAPHLPLCVFKWVAND